LLAYSAKSVGKTYNALSRIEWWARMITGWLFILLGIWFSLTCVFELEWLNNVVLNSWSSAKDLFRTQ
jgi:hypothetical protein